MATDSSPFEHVVDPGFPSTRLMFTQMSAVLVDLDQLRGRIGRFVDPAAIRDAEHATVMAGVLPSSNLVRADGTPPLRAFREAVDELLRTRTSRDGRCLRCSQRFRPTASTPTASRSARFPAAQPVGSACRAGRPQAQAHRVRPRGTPCPLCGEEIMFTDLLRAHETFREHGENGEACGRVLSVAERLITLGFLDHVHARMRGVSATSRWSPTARLRCSAKSPSSRAGILRRMQVDRRTSCANEGLRLPVSSGSRRAECSSSTRERSGRTSRSECS